MIFVIDIRVRPFALLCSVAPPLFTVFAIPQDLYQHAISKLVDFVVAAYHEKPDMNFEIFVHKAEKLAEDDKLGPRHLDLILDAFSLMAQYRKLPTDSRTCR